MIGEELRSWRRRRGVSQFELALRAGTTQRHVSHRERPVEAWAGHVIRLAESLEVPLRERNELLLCAGYAPAYEETRWDDGKLAARGMAPRIVKLRHVGVARHRRAAPADVTQPGQPNRRAGGLEAFLSADEETAALLLAM